MGRRKLESLGELFGESAMGALRASGVWTLVLLAAALTPGADHGPIARGRTGGRRALSPGPRWLRLICSEKTILERCTVEAPDDEIHLFGVGCINEGEPLGFLCFRVANYLHVVESEVFCGQPRLDIVFGYPHR